MDFSVFAGGVQPDLGLAALDEVLRGFGVFADWGDFFTESDDVFVALRPILEEREFFEELFLFLGDAHACRELSAEWARGQAGFRGYLVPAPVPGRKR